MATKEKLIALVQAVNAENADLELIRTLLETVRLDREDLETKDQLQLRECAKKYRQLQRDELFEREINDKPITTNNELVEHGQTVLNETISSEQRIVSMIEDTKAIGQHVAIKIQSQEEGISKTNQKLDEIDSVLGQSMKTIGRMAKRTAQSKVIWILLISLLVLIIIVIVLKS